MKGGREYQDRVMARKLGIGVAKVRRLGGAERLAAMHPDARQLMIGLRNSGRSQRKSLSTVRLGFAPAPAIKREAKEL